MQLFDPQLACKIGLIQAIVWQELMQRESGRWPLDPGNGVIQEDGLTWFRYDSGDLREMFPYLSLDEIDAALKDLERIGAIACRRGTVTDYIWIARRR